MKLINQSNRSAVMAGMAATLAVAAMGFAGAAQARDNVYWSVGVGTPGAVVNVGNVGSVYPQPVYVQPQPVYMQPQPVYMQPAPVYVQQRPVYARPAPIYVAPQPVYYERPHGHRHRGGQHWRGYRDGGNYAPVYYQRDRGYDRDDRRHGDR